MFDPDREVARSDFLRSAGRGDAALDPLPVDASFRRYFRLTGSRPPMLLMDAPPPREDVRPFIRMARHLVELGLSAPQIHEVDEAQGFALIEDFGDGTYTRLLDAGAAAEPLFAAACDALAVLHAHAWTVAVPAPDFDRAKLLDEISELPDWYAPACRGVGVSEAERADFLGDWSALLDSLDPCDSTLVLLDFHVDNLMWLPDRTAHQACGLLDFQDARIGPAPYDLMTLLHNERRGIDPALSETLFDRYVRTARPANPEGFALWYRVLAAQRYTKVLGRFARLTLRDGRNGYLRYMPRATMLLDWALTREPLLEPIRRRLDAVLPDWRISPPDDPAAVRARVAMGAGQS